MDLFLRTLRDQDDSAVLTSCEPELQELMRQIDIMVAQKQTQWDQEMKALKGNLADNEKDLKSTRDLLERKQAEVDLLRQHLEENRAERQELVAKHEEQLQHLRSELAKLKHSYEKLQRKYVKEARKGARSQEEAQSEVTPLSSKIEQLQTPHQQQEPTNHWCHAEVQKLRGQLERAQDALQVQELQLKQLGLLQEELEDAQRERQVLTEEKVELQATLDAQDKFMLSSGVKQLHSKLTWLTQTLQAKEHVIQSLEDCFADRGLSAGLTPLRQDLEKTLMQLQSSRALEEQLKAEVARLQDMLEKMQGQSNASSGKQAEPNLLEEEYSHSLGEVKKLRDELELTEQRRLWEVEGMKKEVSQLASELHQREITIATLSGSASSIERQLRAEMEQSEHRAAELKVTQVQLETLKIENQHLTEILEQVESRPPKKVASPLASLGDSYVSSLNSLEQENKKLKQELAEVHSRLEASTQSWQEKYERALLQSQGKASQLCTARDSKVKEVPHSHQDALAAMEAKMQDVRQLQRQLEPPPQALPNQLDSQSLGSRSALATSSLSASYSPMEGLAQGKPPLLPPRLDDSAEHSSSTSPVEFLHLIGKEESFLQTRCAVSSVDSVAAHYLEEESLRSQELLQKLDSHIHDMLEDNAKTMQKYLKDKAKVHSD
ncbi:centrosomal protein of 63 kDa isoform X1 [Brienomyrus brachyistius]|uniref:centrosomal protein of 63 kDa isoform X1 n=1 Tax=Brienomyrus brachyistius TaxID=42636 RepID=UPI0020B2E271|nr:centrosomal protein of 63 kDa isoform X1 [Brienomyrus brachyistius]XP_048832778.1 centrosomal protein of 63 kDa isoform X1 [Brienomyrus brachyistius]XP_048832779.1 centrosomal protein of 63 kDa isoform X1 [Brienomyrus brachyistius]XP_048832780.1 centrosomal protein of 63 kDa isoform X1 [Brienomyrus brachyistius]